MGLEQANIIETQPMLIETTVISPVFLILWLKSSQTVCNPYSSLPHSCFGLNSQRPCVSVVEHIVAFLSNQALIGEKRWPLIWISEPPVTQEICLDHIGIGIPI